MFKDGLYRIVQIEVRGYNTRGVFIVRLWFSDTEYPRWPVWGKGSDYPTAVENGVESFGKQRQFDVGRLAKAKELVEVSHKKHGMRMKRHEERGIQFKVHQRKPR
jgi:hypothetical protein